MDRSGIVERDPDRPYEASARSFPVPGADGDCGYEPSKPRSGLFAFAMAATYVERDF